MYLDTVVALAKAATIRNSEVAIKITTNARFADTKSSCASTLSQIPNLASVRISFDDLHRSSDFVTPIENIVAWTMAHGVRCSINASALNPMDLVLLRSLPSLGIPIAIGKIAPFGRARGMAEKLSWQEDVRTIPEALAGKCSATEKAVYFPKRGWTFCCSAVTFDCPEMDSEFFALRLEELDGVPALAVMKALSFSGMIASMLPMAEKPLHNCQICKTYWQGLKHG